MISRQHERLRSTRRILWILFAILIAIGLAAAVRRTVVLLSPTATAADTGQRRLTADLDAGFTANRTLSLTHIVPAAVFFVLLPLQFLPRVRTRWLVWHRWAGRASVVLGLIVGITAIKMSYTTSIGGANETAATTLFGLLFLFFLLQGYRYARLKQIRQHREWMIRACGVALGIATTRPIVGAFFAARRLSPHEFFGIAFWLGFSTTLLAAEAWIQHSRPLASRDRAA